MKKKFFSLSNLILGSLIMFLGFGSCRTHKDVKEDEAERARQQELRQKQEQEEQERIQKEMERRQREQIPVTVYAAPPTIYRE